MPKCLECGFVAPRLQWTHFKYKCTGRFQNGKEYQKAYPAAKLVDDDLAKKTAVTLENMIVKYGEEVGAANWQKYKEKQAYSNSYEFKKNKYGWTEEQYEEFNKSRAVTLENMIAKYGEPSGTAKWQEYCNQQAYTNTLNYFISKYGDKEGHRKYNSVCAAKAHTVDNIMRVHSCSRADAVQMLQDRRSASISSLLEEEFVSQLEQVMNLQLSYTCKTKQYCVYDQRPYFYDIVHNNRAIEFNGDYWHCNPAIYSANYYHSIYSMLASEVWARDAVKINALKTNRNIDTLVVWESDYLNRTNEIIEECVKWLTWRDSE